MSGTLTWHHRGISIFLFVALLLSAEAFHESAVALCYYLKHKSKREGVWIFTSHDSRCWLLSVVKTGIPLTLECTTALWGPKCWTPLYKSIHFRVKLWVKLMVSVKLWLQSIFTLMLTISVIFKNKTLILYLIISLPLLSCFLIVMHLKAGCQPPWNKERRHSN